MPSMEEFEKQTPEYREYVLPLRERRNERGNCFLTVAGTEYLYIRNRAQRNQLLDRDLSPSTKTELKGKGYFSPENREGRNIRFGIREHAESPA